MPASVVVMGKVHRPERYAPDKSLNTGLLREALEKQDKIVFLSGQGAASYPAEIVEFLQPLLREGDVVVLLSNGSFGGLKNLLIESLG